MHTLCVSIPVRDQWPSDDDMRERDAAIAELEAGGIGECVGTGAGCEVMEFCLDVPDVESARAALDTLLGNRFPGRRVIVSLDGLEDESEVRQRDRSFFDSLGAEREGVPCRHPGCTRGAVAMSVLCKQHHFEQVLGRACPFTG